MAIGLENLTPFINPVTANYPYGDIKDSTGVGDGTDVNRHNHADYHQTFRKLLSDALISPNNLPDNVTNGYQYINALRKIYKNCAGVNYITATGTLFLTISQYNLHHLVNTTANKIVWLYPDADLKDGDTVTIFNQSDYKLQINGNSSSILGTPTGQLFLNASGDFVVMSYLKSSSTWVMISSRITNAWITPTTELGSNWTIPSTFTTYPNIFQYRVNSLNQLEFRGLIKCVGGAGSNVFLTMPSGFRSIYFKQIFVFDTVNALNLGFYDHTTYELSISAPTTNHLYSLDNLKISLDK